MAVQHNQVDKSSTPKKGRLILTQNDMQELKKATKKAREEVKRNPGKSKEFKEV